MKYLRDLEDCQVVLHTRQVVPGGWFQCSGVRFQVSGFGCLIPGFGSQISGFWFRVSVDTTRFRTERIPCFGSRVRCPCFGSRVRFPCLDRGFGFLILDLGFGVLVSSLGFGVLVSGLGNPRLFDPKQGHHIPMRGGFRVFRGFWAGGSLWVSGELRVC